MVIHFLPNCKCDKKKFLVFFIENYFYDFRSRIYSTHTRYTFNIQSRYKNPPFKAILMWYVSKPLNVLKYSIAIYSSLILV